MRLILRRRKEGLPTARRGAGSFLRGMRGRFPRCEVISLSNIDCEVLRQHFRPKRIAALFVGESPPEGETFFYQADSRLYRATHEAFSYVWRWNEGLRCECSSWRSWPSGGQTFLHFFQGKGCYLEDLCAETVNGLPRAERRRAREGGIAPLVYRLAASQPEVVIVVMKAIQRHVEQAVNHASKLPGWAPRCLEALPFPAHGHQREYVDELKSLLLRLREKGTL